MDKLTEEINKKHGFLYKIDDEYYYMGMHIFARADKFGDTTIKRYNDYLECNRISDETEARKKYQTIILRSKGRRSEDINIVQKLDDFIKKLDKREYDSLKQQVDNFSKMYSKYGFEN